MKRPRIGILGGMGPMAGVHLQRLIVEATPAGRDQDHLEVVCFTKPGIPDRTDSLRRNGGRAYVEAVREGITVLAAAGATLAVIPCNAAHARLPRIAAGMPIPVIDMVALAAAELEPGRKFALLATDGTRMERLYERAADGSVGWIYPDLRQQEAVTEMIYEIKAGRQAEQIPRLLALAGHLTARGAERMILGCTELSLCHDALTEAGFRVVDPLRILAAHLVRTAQGAEIERAAAVR